MGRPWREEYKSGIYHVIARGNNKEYIFKESVDKGYFIKLLKEYAMAMGYKIYGYVLMDNHYHIIIQTMDKKLQEIMHQINNKYSKYFNYKYERVGHVFQGRYKAVLVQDERYMMYLLRYVHQNPVHAGMCKAVEEYKWSSDIYYRKEIRSFVETGTIMEMLSSNEVESRKKYKEFMNEEEMADYDKMNIIGDEAYQVLCISRKKERQRERLDEILANTVISNEDYYLIKQGSRKRVLTEYKLKFIKEAIKQHYTYQEIGQSIRISGNAVKDTINRYINIDDKSY